MAVQLKLPDPAGLPHVVLFHREHPADPILILQVPDPGAEESETYLIRLDRPAHRTWMLGLGNGGRLLDMLQMEMHVAYSPGDGGMRPLRDLDEPPPLAQTFDEARKMATHSAMRERFMRRPSTLPPAMSRFRMRLMGRHPGGPGMPATKTGGF